VSQECLSQEEIAALISSIDDLRDNIIISLFLETGINLNELTYLRKEDLDLATRTLKIRKETTKNKEERLLSISQELAEKLKKYLEQENPKTYLFTSRQSRKITERRVQQLLDHYSQKSLNKKINPRILRSTCIITQFINKIPIPEIEKKVGISIQPYIYHYFKNER